VRSRIPAALVVLAIIALAWGALAFGAVYDWAYTPLAAACALVGASAILLQRRSRPRLGDLTLALGGIAVAVSVQLVPVPEGMLARLSPNVDAFLRQYSIAYVMAQATGESAGLAGGASVLSYPLSIVPDRTVVGLMLFAAFGLFLLGMTRLLSAIGARIVCRAIVGLGVTLAIVAFAQAAIFDRNTRLMYGFWRPAAEVYEPFGPFVNPNHYAGWMLMAVPIALAVFYDALRRMLDNASPNATFVSYTRAPEFAAVGVSGFASVLMGTSLVMTRSRSGIIVLAVGSVLAAWAVARRQQTSTAKLAVAGSFAAFLLGTTAWAGFGTAASKFVATRSSVVSLSGRIDAWRDTLGIIGRFPLTGTGLNTYGAAMEVYQTHDRALMHFREAHNDYLQLAAEGGILLGVPIVVTIVLFIRTVRRRFREAPKDGSTYWLRVGAVVGLVSIALQALVEFSLQMPGNAALFCVLAAVALHQSPHLRRRAPDHTSR
jgi:O-antigen ligase/polysaccharide polymerase Wzy-like membrane protein